MLLYSVPATRVQLGAYAQRRALVHPDVPHLPMSPLLCLAPSLASVRTVLRKPSICLGAAFTPDSRDLFVVTLYTNYSMRKLQCASEDEADIVRGFQDELGISDPPMWYWSRDIEW
ncbi:hypothetical protein BV25DRAFT_1830921 [Artomyces pyxidatus]|uniref:Uncharacterized protein n=1 Tax=Artomyces pyxidatus TaxID=48021 RepID=A0ACB8SN35_9AGAM|nr:hypothetical protein BV25DRAFT_1830921 [Artomyces pyxidatus]